MGWVYDGAIGVLEYYDRRGERVHKLDISAAAGTPGILDLLFHAADSTQLTDEDIGRLVRLLAVRGAAERRRRARGGSRRRDS